MSFNMAFSFTLLNSIIMKLSKISKTLFIGLSTVATFSCTENNTADIVNPNAGVDSANDVFTAAE